jgi:uncharacterized protein (UPF0264 family)
LKDAVPVKVVLPEYVMVNVVVVDVTYHPDKAAVAVVGVSITLGADV